MTEIQIQSAAWRAVWQEIPELRRCFFHVPNESTYNNSQQSSSGVVPGIQDMLLLCNGRAWLIELKDAKGRISDAQKVTHSFHKTQGFDTYVFRTPEDTIGFVRAVFAGRDVAIEYAAYISPYSDAYKYPQYLAEYQAKKKSRNK